MKPILVRRRLEEHRPALGTMLCLARAPEAMLLLAATGFDFVIIDRQHASFSDETVASMICAARSTTLSTLVRPSSSAAPELALPLDMGAAGLMVPSVDTRAQAEGIVQATRYEPLGRRSLSFGQAHTGYQRVDPKEFVSWANRELLILVEIESEQAVSNCREICSTPGVDGFVIGPGDLGQSLGLVGQPDHPVLEEAIREVLECGRSCDAICGIYTSDVEMARRRLEQGFELIVFSSDAKLLRGAGEAILAQLRASGSTARP